MSNERLEMLKQFVEANPEDCFTRYGLAHEYLKLDRLDEAIEAFDKIFEINADYQAAYYHAGQTYRKLGRGGDARNCFEKGIALAGRTGDEHAKSELQTALEELSAG